jgi:hypothetical protein
MKYFYHENREFENARWVKFNTKDELINYLVSKLGDDWRKVK